MSKSVLLNIDQINISIGCLSRYIDRYCAAVYLVGYTNSVTVRDPLKSVVGIVIVIIVVVVVIGRRQTKAAPAYYVCVFIPHVYTWSFRSNLYVHVHISN